MACVAKRTAVATPLHHFTRSRLAWFLLNASGTERPCRYSPFSACFPKCAWFARVEHHLLSLGGRRACFAIDNARSRLRGGGRGCPRWRRRVAASCRLLGTVLRNLLVEDSGTACVRGVVAEAVIT